MLLRAISVPVHGALELIAVAAAPAFTALGLAHAALIASTRQTRLA